MKVLLALVLWGSVSSQTSASSSVDLESRQFDHVRVGEPVSELPFPCRIVCEGQVGTHWFKLHEKDHHVTMFTVVYNAKKMNGDPVASHTLELVDALRDHSYANNPEPFMLGMHEDTQGHVVAWLDMKLKIAYLEDPDDEARGITEVVYCQADAPIFAAATTKPSLTTLAGQMYAFISHPPK